MNSGNEAACKIETGGERWVLTATILASSMVFIDSSALNVALPVIQMDLGASGIQLLWIVNAYLLMLASFILIGGALGDKFGRNRVCSLGIIMFSLGSLAGGLAPAGSFLIGARFLQGIGGALMIPGSLAIITACFMAGARGRAIGTWAAATTVVTVGGPILGGFLAGIGFWRGVFLINLPIAIIALSILYYKVPESRDTESPAGIDLPGAIAAAAGMASLTYGFLSAPEKGFGEPSVYFALAAGVVLVILFIAIESRSRHPMMPLAHFKSRDFSGANLLTMLLYGALSMGMFFLAVNLVQIQDYSPLGAGLAFLPFAVGISVLSRWSGGLVSRIGPRTPLIIGPFLAGAGFLLLAFAGLTSGPDQYWSAFFPGILMFGVGMGLTVAPLTTTVMSSLESHFAGTASGINNSISRVAGVLSIAVLGSLAILVFSAHLEDRTAGLGLSNAARNALEVEARKLGDAQVPQSVPAEYVAEVSGDIRQAFVSTFRLVLIICALMAWLGALASAIFISNTLEMKE